MKRLFCEIYNRIIKGEKAVLCTILASSGSSPRGAGSRMAVLEDGTALGTVGGGEVELQATREALAILKGEGNARLRAFCLAPEQVNSIGMICGGNVTIYYQLISQENEAILSQLIHALDQDENCWLHMELTEGVVSDFRMVDDTAAALKPELYTARAVYKKGEPLIYTEPIVRAGTVYLFGGGHVGQALVPVLANVGFRVTMYDNRDFMVDLEHFPKANRVILGDYHDIYSKVTLTENDYVVIMTPGHQADYALLEQVLRTKTKYVGCIGSHHKIAKTQQLLREAGIDEAAIQSVHSPIGLPILAETPAEIAISIAAEMIKCRAEKN